MDLNKTRTFTHDECSLTLEGDGTTMPRLKIRLSEGEVVQGWVDSSDLIALGKKLQKWGKKLAAA